MSRLNCVFSSYLSFACSMASGKPRPFSTEMTIPLPSASKQPLCSVGSIGTLQMAPPLRKRERREKIVFELQYEGAVPVRATSGS